MSKVHSDGNQTIAFQRVRCQKRHRILTVVRYLLLPGLVENIDGPGRRKVRRWVRICLVLASLVIALGMVLLWVEPQTGSPVWVRMHGEPWKIREGKFRWVVSTTPDITRDGWFHQLGPLVVYRFTEPAVVRNALIPQSPPSTNRASGEGE